MKLFFFLCIIFNSDILLRNEFESKLNDEKVYNTSILQKARECLKKDFDVPKELKEQRLVITPSLFKRYEKLKQQVVLEKGSLHAGKIYSSFLNSELDNSLIRLLLSIKFNRRKRLSYCLVPSIYLTMFIQNLMIVTSSDRRIKDNPEHWKNFIKDVLGDLSYKIFIGVSSFNNLAEADEKSLRKDIMSFLIVAYRQDLLEQYELFLINTDRYPFFNNSDVRVKFFDTTFKTKYFSEINYIVDAFGQEAGKKYFMLFNFMGIQHNRICESSLVDLYRETFYRTFGEYKDFETTDLADDKIDISYLKGKTFRLGTKRKFEYFMGVFQYISCCYKKHLICEVKKNSSIITVINVSGPPIEEILDFYRGKNDITEEVKKNSEMYIDKLYVCSKGTKKYRVTKQDGDILVHSKCLLLECCHVLFGKLLEKFYLELSERCFTCGAEPKVEAYFEIDYYTNSSPNTS